LSGNAPIPNEEGNTVLQNKRVLYGSVLFCEFAIYT